MEDLDRFFGEKRICGSYDLVKRRDAIAQMLAFLDECKAISNQEMEHMQQIQHIAFCSTSSLTKLRTMLYPNLNLKVQLKRIWVYYTKLFRGKEMGLG